MALFMNSMFMLALLTLIPPLMVYIINPTKKWPITMTKKTVKTSFFITLLQLLIFMNYKHEFIITNMKLPITSTLNINMSFKFDQYSIMFIPIALYVTWSILEFTHWYMHKDPHLTKFFKYLLTFLMTMMILVTANNLFQLFIGWEGVGIMSFLLIGWWRSRMEANVSAMKAMIYNRVGDIGLILSMSWLSTNQDTWELQQMFANTNNPIPLLPLLGFILAATGKSAQFGLHPWLPSAMEGPTPVSALLHSSTMVVAGIFLLIRIHPMLSTNKMAMSTCLCLGAITTLFAALCAITQYDIKKIIAFSTASQLGLMMVTMGLNQPQLALLHICMHAFFKAMLFLCAGSISHNLNNEQDIRKMGGLHKCMPTTSSCFTIGNMALTGMPFLTGFYSKDAIIEAMTTSHLNSWALLMTLTATSFTAIYSLRITLHVQTGNPQFISMLLLNEDQKLTKPIIRLAKGSIIAGLLISWNITWTKTPLMTMPMYVKIMALTMSILSAMLALQLILTMNKLPKKPSSAMNFSITLGYYDLVKHRLISKTLLKFNQNIATHLLDQSWYDHTGPKGLAKLQITPSTMMPYLQKGLIKTYMISFMMTMTLLLMMT